MLTVRESRLRLTAEIRGLRLWKVQQPAENGYVLSKDNITIIERASLEEIETALSGAALAE